MPMATVSCLADVNDMVWETFGYELRGPVLDTYWPLDREDGLTAPLLSPYHIARSDLMRAVSNNLSSEAHMYV